ncbi:MAG: hypothetical protein A2458_05170, partial [Candidatus Kerfeldbacteria bacterium RIFOXYC2_FULL_38_9]
MSTAKIHSLNLTGLDCSPIEIEVDVSAGLPNFIIVGLPDAAVSEARDRVRSAIKNSGFQFPRTRVTVNLAPAHTKKMGSLFDLPIALGILLANGSLLEAPAGFFVGELALDGNLHAITGALPIVYAATKEYQKSITIPQKNSAEASLIVDKDIYVVNSLACAVANINNKTPVSLLDSPPSLAQKQSQNNYLQAVEVDMQEIVGQQVARRALEIVAAGGHNLLMSGPPGVGKSMLARALPSILPPMTEQEIVETTMMYSVATNHAPGIVTCRPFRAPHHTASAVAIIGGGHNLQPGELSLAHRGVLFLDELPEFRRDVIEALRQPLEEGRVTISRSTGRVEYPARCQFVGAMNPCPCGYFGVTDQHPELKHKECSCLGTNIERYRKKISGPLLDRIDIKIHVSYMSAQEIQNLKAEQKRTAEPSSMVRQRTQKARNLQQSRQGKTNAELSNKEVYKWVIIDENSQELLRSAMKRLGLSMRGYMKTLKVSRTIAD